MATERTLPRLFEDSATRFAKNPFIWEKKEGPYRPTTYEEIRTRVHQCAAGLLGLGIRSGDRVALISEGRSEWVVAELGILYTGAINVPLSVKIEELSELKFRLTHSGCRMAIVSGPQTQKVRTIKDQLPDLQCLILLDHLEDRLDYEVLFDDVLTKGKDLLAGGSVDLHRVWQAVRENDPANICYTSGTVADPKGIVLTHRNYSANIDQGVALYPLPQHYCTLLILPWDHAFAHTAGIYALSATGASAATVQLGKTPMETLRNIPSNIKEIRPTFLLSVPSLAKNLRKGIEKGIREKGRLTEILFHSALSVAYACNGNGWNKGKGWRKILKPLNRLYDTLIFRKIRENFGGRLDYFIGGGALLDVELQRFFYAIGTPMYQGYGLTEAAPVISANTPAKHKMGSSGVLVPDLQIRICDDQGEEMQPGQPGEIVVKGENVMAGYWRNEKATADAIRDGWLFTGDLGYLDADGFLIVLGREKSLLIAHDGEKFSPEGIEETIVSHSPYIDQIMLYNSQSPYTVALLVLNQDALRRWALRHRHSLDTPDGQDAALRLLKEEIDAYRSGGKYAGMFPERWLPGAIAVLDEPFTEQNRFLNSTLKMVRARITEFNRTRLEYLFTPEGKEISNGPNRLVVGRVAT